VRTAYNPGSVLGQPIGLYLYGTANGKKSSGKQMRALNICYFFNTDQVEKGHTQIEHCGTDNMVSVFL
jgi:hypothetical protein